MFLERLRTLWLAALLMHGSAIAAPALMSTGLPVPRFVTLAAERANARVGPGMEYPVAWVYVRSGIPLEIVQEFGNWRRIRDWEGKSGWIFHSLLSGRRTALAAPWQEEGAVPVRADTSLKDRIIAYLEPMVRASLLHCDGDWCRVRVSKAELSGYVRQTRLWGVYPGETLGDDGWW